MALWQSAVVPIVRPRSTAGSEASRVGTLLTVSIVVVVPVWGYLIKTLTFSPARVSRASEPGEEEPYLSTRSFRMGRLKDWS